MSTDWKYELVPSSNVSGQDLSASVGYAVYDDGTDWNLIADATQAAVQARRPRILADGGAESGDQVVAVREGDDVPAMAGTGGWTKGDTLIVEASTGKLISVETSWVILKPGDWLVGEAHTTTSANTRGRIRLQPKRVNNPRTVVAPVLENTAGAVTYSEAQIAVGLVKRDCNGGARTDLLPSGDDLTNLLPEIGSSFTWILDNRLSLNAGENITVANSADGTHVAVSSPLGLVVGDTKVALCHTVRIAASGAGSVVTHVNADGT